MFPFSRTESEPLLSFEKVQSALQSRSYSFQGLQTIPLESVVGSEGRSNDFARDFRPEPRHLERIKRLAEAGQEALARPIEVFQVDQVYFIRDGHHRVALARSRGKKEIEALVTQVLSRASITAELPGEEVLLRAQLSRFLQETNLDQHAPNTDFTLKQPELYATLLQHIEVHRYYLGHDYQKDFTLEEAAASWHDLVYKPLLEVLEVTGVVREFPRRSPAELYLWIAYHREQLRCRGEYNGDAEVAAALVEKFSERPGLSLFRDIQRVWNAAWNAARERPEPPKA